MATYTVTRACGHKEKINLSGKADRRQWMLENVEKQKICYFCYQKELQEKRENENKKAAEEARKMELPELTGTEKQIAWAETIRLSVLKKTEEVLDNVPEKKKQLEEYGHFLQGIAEIEKQAKASWWIEHRFAITEREVLKLANFMYSIADKKVEEEALEEIQKQKDKEEKKLIMEAKAEATVYPENSKTNVVAEICIDKDEAIEVYFPERRDDFMEIVKGKLYMRWNMDKKLWRRMLNFKQGNPADRAAEAGNRLLADGFPVRIYDNDVRSRALSGDYVPECTRWITKRIKGKYEDWFVIQWGKNEDFYKAARAIGGSRYDSHDVIVPPEKFEEVLDFAEMYEFKLSDGAKNTVDKYRSLKENSLIAKIEKPTKIKPDPLNKPPKLEIPLEVGVADEFKD